MKNILSLIVLFFACMQMQAQNTTNARQTINGKVVDKSGMGIPMALVIVESTQNAVECDFDGNFTAKVKENDKLKVSMVGFVSQTVTASNGIRIVLKESKDTELNEVVVVGYGTKKKSLNTGAIAQVSSSEITKNKVANATQALQGKAAGVQVVNSDVPGAAPSLIIRGVGTVGSGRNPLYVVDGVPTSSISNINSNDIATFDILKDAATLAIYGNQAANGVVVITTKRGKGEKMSIDYDGYAGIRTPMRKLKMADSQDFIRYSNAAAGRERFSADNQTNTDWFDAVTQTASYVSNNISLSGSTNKVVYYFGANFYQEEGLLKGMSFNRFTIRNNNEFKISDKLKITQNLSITPTNSTPKPLKVLSQAYKQSSLVPVYFDNGRWGQPIVNPNTGMISPIGESFNNVGNPMVDLTYFNEQQRNLMLQGSLGLEYKIHKNIKFNSLFGAEYNNWRKRAYTPSKLIWLAADPSRLAAGYSDKEPINELVVGQSNYFNWNLDNYFTFNKKWNGKHDLEVTLGVTAQEFGSAEEIEIKGRNVPELSNYWSLSLSSNPTYNIASKHYVGNASHLLGYFGRFQYIFDDKYILNGTLRQDGSSKFYSDYKVGFFPSFSLGWIISNESFLKDNKNINFLKLKAGWGKLGNQNVPTNMQTFSSGMGYELGGNLDSGISINKVVDKSLSWEVSNETSIGLEYKAFNNKLSGSIDYYNKNTSNVILWVNPPLTAGTEAYPSHAGEISNKGIELSMRWDDKINDNLKYYVGANFSTNKNEVTNVYNPMAIMQTGGNLGNGHYAKMLKVGQPIGSFYLYETAGLDSNGNFLYLDANGQKTSTPTDTDRKFMGSCLPTYYYGIQLGLQYKNLDFSVDGYGVGGNKVYNGKRGQRFGNENIEAAIASDFWTPSNTNAAHPKAFNNVPLPSDYYLESGAFFRINNISLGYTLPALKNFPASARIYLTAINPFNYQKFSGFTAELNNDGNPMGQQGIELDAYPSLRSFVIGASFKF